MTVYAADPSTGSDGVLNGVTPIGDSTTGFDVSKNVTVTYLTDTNGVGFTAISNHLSGDTLYGAGSDTTQLFRTTTGKTKGVLNETLPGDTNSTKAFPSATWDKM